MRDLHDMLNEGMDTGSGHLSGRAAALQMLIIPVLILCFGLVFALLSAIE